MPRMNNPVSIATSLPSGPGSRNSSVTTLLPAVPPEPHKRVRTTRVFANTHSEDKRKINNRNESSVILLRLYPTANRYTNPKPKWDYSPVMSTFLSRTKASPGTPAI
ncbi:hypothetical protein ACJJTC_003592 [Scirpophaga incertulas]